MFGITDFWLFLLAGLMLNITPGPDTAYVVARSTAGLRSGALAALGIGAGCFVHITAAAIGVSALVMASATAFAVLKLAGAAYLVGAGTRMLWQTRRQAPAPAEAAGGAPLVAMTSRAVFWQGFWTNVLNPKVAIFFLAFLPQFIGPGAGNPTIAFISLGLVFNVTGTAWNIAMAWMAARTTRALGGGRGGLIWIERALGAMFIGLGLKLALAERTWRQS